MESQTEQAGSSTKDTVFLAAATLLLLGGMGAFYYFAVQWVLPLRLAVLFGAIAASVFLTYQTAFGKVLVAYLVGSRAELRKVVWPNRQETVQTTLLIAVVVLIVALLMWGLDSLLLVGVHQLTQRST
jgi:preprotein translocase subunit SecE